MKNKYILMLPIISLAASGSSWAQASADVPAAANINLKAEFVEAKPADDVFAEIADIISKEKNVDGKTVLNALGLGDITSYAISSEKDGKEWKNLMFLHNNGSDKGIFRLLGKKEAVFSAPQMSPEGSDLVIQMDVDIRTLEDLLRNIMEATDTPEAERQNFEDFAMLKSMFLEGMTTSSVLSKINLRVNLAIDLDNKAQVNQTVDGDPKKPRFVARIDGVAWIMDKIGELLIPDNAFNKRVAFLKKDEGDGITSYSLPPERPEFKGYPLVISVDKNKDQIWIASSQDFLKLSSEGSKSLGNSDAYKSAMNGLPEKGNAMIYMTKGYADYVLNLTNKNEENPMTLQMMGGSAEAVSNTVEMLKKVDTAYVLTLSRAKDGIFISGRNPEKYKSMLKEIEKITEKFKTMLPLNIVR